MIGYDHVVKIDTNHASDVAPLTIEVLREAPAEPFFLSVGFFETHREFFAPTSVRDALYSRRRRTCPTRRETRQDMAAFKASARSLDQGIGAVLDELDDFGLGDEHPGDLHDRPRASRSPARRRRSPTAASA